MSVRENDTQQETRDIVSKRRTPLRLVSGLAALASAVVLTLLAIVWFVPDQNDYADVTVAKHRRLASVGSPKIILVGGSNLAYGVDSPAIERELGCPVVNMGMNGYLGVRYLLEEIKADLHPSDTIVLAFEWDNYFKPIDGDKISLLGIVKANPHALAYLTFGQTLDVLRAVPDVTRVKFVRALRESVVRLVKGPSEKSLIDSIESLSGFTAEGDLTSHLGVPWPYGRELETFKPGAQVDPQVLPYVARFAETAQRENVKVLFSYPPVPRDFYARHSEDVAGVHQKVVASAPVVAPSAPADFVFEEGQFFDTVYHLNETGRPLRTQKLIRDLKASAACRAGAHAAHL